MINAVSVERGQSGQSGRDLVRDKCLSTCDTNKCVQYSLLQESSQLTGLIERARAQLVGDQQRWCGASGVASWQCYQPDQRYNERRVIAGSSGECCTARKDSLTC